MFKNLHIEGYRCFESLRVEGLKRVNLFVGANNAGKTSLLEAVDLLATGSPGTLQKIALLRTEVVTEVLRDPFTPVQQLRHNPDCRYAFCGRAPDVGSRLHVTGERDRNEPSRQVYVEVKATDTGKVLGWRVDDFEIKIPFAVTQRGWVMAEINMSPIQARVINVFWLYAVDATFDLVNLWSTAVIGRGDEQLVLEAVQTVEPNVEDIRLLSIQTPQLFVGLKGVSERVPIGNLGRGASRLLALGCLFAGAKGGVLIVDEIDTGLHVSVMEKMWQLVFETAQKLDVQVFATTHSKDCLRGLANVLEDHADFKEQVSLHRLDKGRAKTIVDDGDEIILALESNIEVR